MAQIACSSCGVKLNIPEEKLPPGITRFKGTCPKCKNVIDVHLDRGASAAGAPTNGAAHAPAAGPSTPAAAPASAPPAAEPPPPPPPPAQAPTAPDIDEDFVQGQRLALACFDDAGRQDAAKVALEASGFTVHLPKNAEEAVARLRRSRYELVLLDEAYGGSRDANQVLKVLQPMPMNVRRHMCVGLVGRELRTFDNMAAFSSSVNFVVGEKDLEKLKELVAHALHDHEHFYRPFLDALKTAGKA